MDKKTDYDDDFEMEYDMNDEEELQKKRNRKTLLKGILIGVLLAVVVSVLLGYLLGRSLLRNVTSSSQKIGNLSFSDSELSSRYDEIESKLDSLQSIIDSYYLNDEDIDEDTLVEGIYKGYVDALDEPYTVYYTSEEYDALKESSSGKYSGIGVVVSQNVDTGVITVVRPFAGSPGAEAGILKDDVLYKVEGQEVTGVDVNEVVTWIKGEEGTSVHVEVYRPSEDKYIEFDVERRTIEVPMVEYRMLENNIGYVGIYEFEETTAEQFDEAVQDLLDQGMQGLVIDLRDNPGGLVNSATAVLDRILPKGKLLVYTLDKNGKKSEEYSEDDTTLDLPITVLINENSASASELVSGCLQDYGCATLVGTTSFGKGIVQYILPLSDGSAIKLTSAKYYTPEGRNIHGTGLDPDVEVELDTDSETDNQLEKAVEVTLEKMNTQ